MSIKPHHISFEKKNEEAEKKTDIFLKVIPFTFHTRSIHVSKAPTEKQKYFIISNFFVLCCFLFTNIIYVGLHLIEDL